MHILITVDPEIPVPPLNYGGIERIVDTLIKSFSKEGHRVYLIAHRDSSNRAAEKIFPWPAQHSRGYTNIVKNSLFLRKTVNRVKPDIIHSFSRLLYLYPVFLLKNIPIVQSYQREISEKSTTMALKVAGKKLSFTSCGAHMVQDHPIADHCTPVHNFTDTDYFVPNDEIAKDFLFFLGRIEDIKGTKEAVEVALGTNQKLIIAGNVQPEHTAYFDTYIKPHLTNPLIEYVGPVNDEQKLHYLQRSKAFLFPIKWEEPFGIVMAEAMACGVPVIGFNRGSVPEVVKYGVTGFVVNDVKGMKDAVHKIGQIDRDVVRKDCLQNFSLEVISREYLHLFEQKIKSLSKTTASV